MPCIMRLIRFLVKPVSIKVNRKAAQRAIMSQEIQKNNGIQQVRPTEVCCKVLSEENDSMYIKT